MEWNGSFPCNARVSIAGPAGELEAVTACPTAAQALTTVICHPHPLYGGTMDNKVVTTLARAVGDLGSRSVRFNFRGVGASEGSFGDAAGETDDLLAVLAWVRAHRPDDTIWLAGFSFGGYVALLAAAKFSVAQLVTVAPSVNRYDPQGLTTPRIPWLVIQGTDDEVVPAADVLGWVKTLAPAPDVVVFDAVGHFFHGRLNDLRAVVVEHLRSRVPGS